jgi:hypothetical protein
MSNPILIAHDVAQDRLADALRLFIGFGRRYSVAAVAVGTGVPERTLQSYCSGQATPGLANLLTLMAFLPPEFTAMLIEPAGLAGVHRIDKTDPCHHTALAEALRTAAAVAEALRDGKVDHREQAEILPIARRTVTALQGYLAHHSGALQQAAE